MLRSTSMEDSMRTFLSTLFFAAAAVSAQAADFKLAVDAGADGGFAQRHTYNGFGCTGQNLAPALHWEGVPAKARSLALTVYDPDAPTGSGWWHWVVLDLPAASTGLPQGGALPASAFALRNDYGDTRWGGPCPPQGDKPHHYVFTIHALDVPDLGLPADASPAKAGFMIRQHTVGTAQVTLRYGR